MPNLTFNYTVAQPVSTQQHIAHKELGGHPDLPIKQGFGRGSHHMLPLDPNGRVNIRPGPGHRSIYFGRAGARTTYTAAQIAAAEGLMPSQITGVWIRNQKTVSIAPYRWGEHPDYALDDSLRYAVTQAYMQSNSSLPISIWFHFERGGSFESIGYLDGKGGYLRHPVVYKAYGNGAMPVFTNPMTQNASPEDNIVLQELDYGKLTDAPLPGRRIKAAMSINQPSKNWLINLCDLSGKDHSLQHVTRFTLRRNRLNDSVFNRPANGTTWEADGVNDRLQGMFLNAVTSFCCLENIIVQSGWKDGYDAVNSPPSGDKGLPPSQYNHGLYVQNDGTDMTFRGNAVTYASSHGAKFQFGAHVTENFWFENPHHFYVWGDPEHQPTPNYSTVWGNVCVGTRWDEEQGNGLNIKIAYFRGIAHYNRVNYSFNWNNAVLHAANPNDPADVAAKAQPNYVQGYAEQLGNEAPWGRGQIYIASWLNAPDENITQPASEINALTFHYWLDDHLSQPRGTATTLSCVNWLRTAMFDYIGHIVGEFLTTLGGSWNDNTRPATITFTPEPKAEGWRWDARYNWDLMRRPVNGDTVRLVGSTPVVSWENIAPTTLDLGTDASLHVDGGLMEIGTLTGSGTIDVIETGELSLRQTNAADVAITLTDGALTFAGQVSDGVSVTVQGRAECVIKSGQAARFGTGRTLRIEGDTPKVGFDGADGTANLTMGAGSVLEFTAGTVGFGVIHKPYTGFAGLNAYNRPNPVAVQSNFVIEPGAVMNVDVSGLAGGTTYDLVIADSVTGQFDRVTVTGGSGTVAYSATKLSIAVD